MLHFRLGKINIINKRSTLGGIMMALLFSAGVATAFNPVNLDDDFAPSDHEQLEILGVYESRLDELVDRHYRVTEGLNLDFRNPFYEPLVKETDAAMKEAAIQLSNLESGNYRRWAMEEAELRSTLERTEKTITCLERIVAKAEAFN